MIAGFVALFAALTSATWIDVPFTRQEKNGCGSASVWMLMEYWGKSPSAVDAIHRTLYSKEAGGIFASDIERFLGGKGFRTASFAGNWADLAENVSKGRPLMVSIEANSRGTPLHYVLVVGVDEALEAVLVNDPAQRKLLPMARSDFERRWDAMNRWTLLAIPEGSAAPATRSRPAPPTPSASSSLDDASAAFRARDFNAARRHIRKDGTGDAFTSEFLATTYFLENNLEAALKYWNRNGSPQLREVQMDFPTRWNPILLDHTLGISRATVLRDEDYVTARKRLDASETFTRYSFDLVPVQGTESEFDLNVRAAERSQWSPLGWFRGLAYETVTPGFTNIGGRAINVESLWRWDLNKRRIALGVSGPVSVNTRLLAQLDARNEIWEMDGQTIPLRKEELRLSLSTLATHRWSWSSGGVLTRRPSGMSLKYEGTSNYDVLRLPESRLTVSAETRGQFGRAFSTDDRIARAEAGIQADWLPKAEGDDYRVLIRTRAGRVWGSAHIDELFALGVDRDEDLWLRGHSTTAEGRKGNGPTGRRYVLLNAEIGKTIFNRGLVKTSIVPFVDIARSGSAFVDTGAEFRVSVASLATFSISIGRDLKAGRTVVFTNATR